MCASVLAQQNNHTVSLTRELQEFIRAYCTLRNGTLHCETKRNKICTLRNEICTLLYSTLLYEHGLYSNMKVQISFRKVQILFRFVSL